MNQNPPILLLSALVVPVAVGLGFAWGVETALAALLSSAVALGNLWVLSILGPRLVRAVAEEDTGTAVILGAAISAKFLLVAALYVWLVTAFPPVGVALGFLPLLGGTLLTALVLARADAAAPTPTGGR